MLRSLATAALAALIASCGGQARPGAAGATAPTAAPEPTQSPDEGSPETRAMIEQLDLEIGQFRTQLGARPGASADQVCEGLSECTDACNLADSICTNADKICEIAADVSDPWALEKCESAKTSCTEAREICGCCEKKLN